MHSFVVKLDLNEPLCTPLPFYLLLERCSFAGLVKQGYYPGHLTHVCLITVEVLAKSKILPYRRKSSHTLLQRWERVLSNTMIYLLVALGCDKEKIGQMNT